MKGKIIIIEGLDSSGKATQVAKLYNRLADEGYKVKKVEFPNYKSPSSLFIKMYLNGEFGSKPEDVSPYIASTFYALDRYVSYKKEWEDFYLSGGIIIADRYTTSNMVHQASKIQDLREKEKYLEWLTDYEYNIYKLPAPDCVIFLNVPPEYSQKLMVDRANKYTGKAEKDIHERNFEYLNRSYKNAMYIIERYKWIKIDCVKNGNLKSIDEIHDLVYSKVTNQIDN